MCPLNARKKKKVERKIENTLDESQREWKLINDA